MKSEKAEVTFKYVLSVQIQNYTRQKIMSFHSSLDEMHLNNSLEDRYWILAIFLHSICVRIIFPIILSFLGKKEIRISEKGPRAEKRTNQKPMPILNHPLRFSFYISEKIRM